MDIKLGTAADKILRGADEFVVDAVIKLSPDEGEVGDDAGGWVVGESAIYVMRGRFGTMGSWLIEVR